MIKLIIFDLSGVISNTEEPIYLAKFARKHRIPLESIQEIYFERLKRSEKGQMPLRTVWQKTMKKFGIEGDYMDHVKGSMSLKRFDRGMLDFICSVRKKYKTAYFTNYAEGYWKLHEKLIDVGKYFDFGVVSYKIGSRKPEPKGFKIIMRHFNAKPEETVFLDDSKKNLKNARVMGIKTIHFSGLAGLKKEFRRLGIVISR